MNEMFELFAKLGPTGYGMLVILVILVFLAGIAALVFLSDNVLQPWLDKRDKERFEEFFAAVDKRRRGGEELPEDMELLDAFIEHKEGEEK